LFSQDGWTKWYGSPPLSRQNKIHHGKIKFETTNSNFSWQTRSKHSQQKQKQQEQKPSQQKQIAHSKTKWQSEVFCQWLSMYNTK